MDSKLFKPPREILVLVTLAHAKSMIVDLDSHHKLNSYQYLEAGSSEPLALTYGISARISQNGSFIIFSVKHKQENHLL